VRSRGRAPILLGVGAAAAGALALGVPAAPASAQTITVSGSTSVAPLASQLARRYVRETDGVNFRLSQGGSDVGISDVARGRVTLGMSSRDPEGGDPGGLVFNRIARDAICIISNRRNRIGNVSQRQVQQIFSGGVRDWGQVRGATVNGTIDLFVRSAPSGTQDAFDNIFMGDLEVSPVASQRASNGLIQQSVRNTPGGIGYVSLAFTEGVRAVRYRGVACNLRNARAGTYGGVRNFWLVSRGRARGAARRWIRWIRRDANAQRIISRGWVPLR
jgi:phosphate transport system substrate-binding protein